LICFIRTILRPIILFVPILALTVTHLYAQQKFSTEKGEVSFTSNAELEIIKASSNKVRGILDPSSNQFAFTVEINSFKGFNSDLQREHFMDNYMEAEKYPRASFSGKLIEQVDFSKDGEYDVRAKGDLDVHGQKQIRILKSKMTVRNGTLFIESKFSIPLDEHSILIPKIVNQKIATEIEVSFKASMSTH